MTTGQIAVVGKAKKQKVHEWAVSQAVFKCTYKKQYSELQISFWIHTQFKGEEKIKWLDNKQWFEQNNCNYINEYTGEMCWPGDGKPGVDGIIHKRIKFGACSSQDHCPSKCLDEKYKERNNAHGMMGNKKVHNNLCMHMPTSAYHIQLITSSCTLPTQTGY